MSRAAYADLLGKPRRNNAEDDLQAAIWSHILVRGTPDTIAYCVPNGTNKSRAQAGKMKAMGLVPGVADLAFVLNDGSAAFMELKVGSNKQSEGQYAFEAKCLRIGVPYVVCRGLDEALSVLEAWGVIRPEATL